METKYKTFRAEVEGVDKDEGTIDMLIPVSSSQVDRDGEVVLPEAFKKTIPKFMKHPVLVASHNYSSLENQIGEWTKLKVEDNGVSGKNRYYINEGNAQADWAFNLASKGVAAFSIGFMPKKWHDGEGEKEPRRTYDEIELLEISQVIIPSNRDAIQSMRSKSADDPIICELCDEAEGLCEVEELEEVTKPEETDEFIRIPVRDCKVTATIDISKKEGISALYCGKEKKVRTYLFRKDKGWTMAKARAWVKEHEGKEFNLEHDVSQAEIADEISYLFELINQNGLSKTNKNIFDGYLALYNLEERIPADDTADDIDPIQTLREIINEVMEVN